MADYTEDLMNLDLNLGPMPRTSSINGPLSGDSVSVDRWESHALRQRIQRHRRWRHGNLAQLPWGPHSLRLMVDSDGHDSDLGVGVDVGVDGLDNGGILQAGEGSVAPELRSSDVVKACENNVIAVEKGSLDEKDDVEKSNSEEGSFFDCNICFDLAKEPVVTCCGHLFCLPCIYQWLHIHSDAKECPVCKGEVTLKNVTPIYGCGNHAVHVSEEDAESKVPVRPSARRVESSRQRIQRTASSFPMDEMIRRLGTRFEVTRDYFLANTTGGDDIPSLARANFLNRIMTSRALRREQNPPRPPPEDVVDLTQDRIQVHSRRLPPLTYRRGQLPRGGIALPNERYREHFSRQSPPDRSQDLQPPSVDDRDSFSSIGAVILGESQIVDTAAEIDSVVSFSTSSSRRRNEPSRTSDVDSGDSRTPRRRRLN